MFAVQCKQLCSSGAARHITVELHVRDAVEFLIDRYDVTDYSSREVYLSHEQYTGGSLTHRTRMDIYIYVYIYIYIYKIKIKFVCVD